MAEFKSAPAQESKKATASPKQEGKIETSELEYSDNRSSTAQLVSLQSAADDKGNRSNTTQLQSKASFFTGSSRVAQLKAASDVRQPVATSAPVQLKAGVPVNNDPKLEREADVMGAKALQGKFMTADPVANQAPASTSKQPFQLVSAAEKDWNRMGDNGTVKGATTTAVPEYNIGSENVDEFVTNMEAYLALNSKIDFEDLKKEKINKENLVLLEKAGLALSVAATGVGVAAVVAAFAATPVGALGLLVAGIGLGITKAAVKLSTMGKKDGAKTAGQQGTQSGLEAGVEIASAAAAGGIGGAGTVIGAAAAVGEAKTISKLTKDQITAKAQLTKMYKGMEDLEAQLSSQAFISKIDPGDGNMDKIAKAADQIKQIKDKILFVDKSIEKGTEETIKSNDSQVNL